MLIFHGEVFELNNENIGFSGAFVSALLTQRLETSNNVSNTDP